MKFLPSSCSGSQTLIARLRATATCVLPCVATFLDSASWPTRQRPRAPCCLLIVLLAVTMMTGCGGSSANTNPVQPAPATPAITPATGTFTGAQQVTITDATPGVTIYVTTDGTVPSSASTAYTGPISISASSTVQAIAILQGVSSGIASSVLTIAPAHPPAKLAFLQQPENALTGATISPAVTVQVEDADGNLVANATNVVTLGLTTV